MANCTKCGVEVKEGERYCEDCKEELDLAASNHLNEMQQNTSDDMEETVEPIDDDFERILKELQGVREDSKETVDATVEEKKASPSTMSDVFSDAIRAISSLEDDTDETVEQNEEPLDVPKKESLIKKLLEQWKLRRNNRIQRRKSRREEKIQTKEKAKDARREAKQERQRASEEEEKKRKTEVVQKKEKKPKKQVTKVKKVKKQQEKKVTPKKDKEKVAKRTNPLLHSIPEDVGRFNRWSITFVTSVFLAVGIYVLITVFTVPYQYSIEVAAQNFEHKKYNQAFEQIYGLNIKQDDTMLYDKIMTVMYVNKQLNSYYNYMNLQSYPDALDSLIKGLKRYNKYIDSANELGITKHMDYVKRQILKELKKEFKLSEQKAMKLAEIEDQQKYSERIYTLAKQSKHSVLQ